MSPHHTTGVTITEMDEDEWLSDNEDEEETHHPLVEEPGQLLAHLSACASVQAFRTNVLLKRLYGNRFTP